jgi:tetratricopeptide (TPR) repeat protein
MVRKPKSPPAPGSPGFGPTQPGTVPVPGAHGRATIPLPGAAAPPPPNVDTILTAASQHHQAGRVDQAEAGYRQALAHAPAHPHALHLMGVVYLQKGDPGSAADYLEKAVAVANNNADFHADLGVALMTIGRNDEGLVHFQRAAELRPDFAMAHYNVGLALVQAGDLPAAAESFRRAVSLDSNLADAHMNLGLILLQTKNGEEAIRHLRRAIELVPDNVVALTNLGNGLIGTGAPGEAISVLERAVVLDQRSALAHFGLANAHDELANENPEDGHLEIAESHYLQALEINPDYFAAQLNLGIVLKMMTRFDSAEACFRRALELRPGEVECMINLAEILVDQDKYEEAMDMYRSMSSSPERLNIIRRLAHLWQEKGEFEKAREVVEELRLKDPQSGIVFTVLSSDRSHHFTEEEVVHAEQLSDDPSVDYAERLSIKFALARYLDTIGDYDRAFPHLIRGNEIAKEAYDFDIGEEEAFVESVENVATPTFFAADDFGSDSERPIFVVGMVRSGTTLAEQIIASHPRVAGGGELSDIVTMTRGLSRQMASAHFYPRCLGDLDAETMQNLGGNYLTRLDAISANADRVTDKMPGNYRHLGLILRLFPRARIVYCRRNPLDNCLSIYFQRFVGYHPYAYDLRDLAHYYSLHQRLMAHWRRVVPTAIHEIAYEDLITDQEGQSRALIEFCGLEWDDQCLRFFETDRSVRTASLWQVRQPVYDSSVDRWRNYEAHLGPLFKALAEAGVVVQGPGGTS